MNKRMYELINQCFISTSGGKLSELNTVANVEKFAQLILLDVTDILSSYRGKIIFEDGAEYNHEHPIVAINKYFGVKNEQL